MRIQCGACEGAAATVVCCADEAALCARCDVQIHAANKLAGKHQRLPLDAAPAASKQQLPRCDVCQDKAAFVFCVEDRALFCGDCDDSIHLQGTLSANHQRYLATGIRVGFSSVCSAHADHHPPAPPSSNNNNNKPPPAVVPRAVPKAPAPVAAAQEVPSSPFMSSSSWAVEDLLQFSDYESSDKKGPTSPLGFKELEWFADIDLFHQDQAPPAKRGRTTAEVPELFASPHPMSNAEFYKTAGAQKSKRARVELPDDDEDYLIVPDLG
ncbi:B-box zinc finger protein 24-like [Lolium rigidum]|uniref:B-box zinc finger protein 24-like n=1 Tax=Lolium rigidum TaxID=89674 RepID=UPI001F5C80CA|nr:B-box zinc finger protein 24-like [Lolium rigidum]